MLMASNIFTQEVQAVVSCVASGGEQRLVSNKGMCHWWKKFQK